MATNHPEYVPPHPPLRPAPQTPAPNKAGTSTAKPVNPPEGPGKLRPAP